MHSLNLEDYQYTLPQEKIATYPLEKRDESKLLIYKDGLITHNSFKNLADQLPSNSFLIFNNTKVIPARLHFKKSTGAIIEIFLLNPVEPSVIISQVMESKTSCTWHCTIGNLKKWNDNLVLEHEISNGILKATLIDRSKGLVKFEWDNLNSFAAIVEETGVTPLPPYLNRHAEEKDKDRYQTIYSKFEGAVAAPTAGLHFTDEVFNSIAKKNIGHDFVTLHVSAGTFQPIKNNDINQHTMHEEQVVVSIENVKNLLSHDFIIPVGTTSMRTIESLYWYGVRLLVKKADSFIIHQDDPYTLPCHFSKKEALEAILQYLMGQNLHQIIGETSIFIKPGYDFKICRALITNFHQPGSTLILLVASFIGNDWRKVYNEALDKNYRFLSYGDSSLLFLNKKRSPD